MRKTMKRSGGFILALILLSTMIPASDTKALASDAQQQLQKTSYRTVMEVEDFGPQITKVIVGLGRKVKERSVGTDTFKVHVVRKAQNPETKMLGEAEGDRIVTKAYISDKDGKAEKKGRYATLVLEIGPDKSLGSALNFSMTTYKNEWVQSDYTITQQKEIKSGSVKISGLVADISSGETKALIDDFTVSQGTYDNITLKYASYTPAKDKAKHPLIIWLHGMGEGGTDGLLGIAGNKVVNFASEKIQAYFGGAYILGPQSPTMWMEGLTVNSFGDGTSKYEKALMALIQEYVSKNPGIDPNRIYIGGCSNGGYMTMLMVRDYPSYFAAAFPTCEALKDGLITDSDINKMKDVPLWFVAAKTDTTVPVNQYVVPTYDRLIKAGAKNVHLSLFDNVIDTSGLYKKEDGTPYEYNGHWSWIYVFNNVPKDTINGKSVTIMKWMAGQSLHQ